MKNQTQDKNASNISFEDLGLLGFTSLAILGPTLRYHLLRSKKVAPKVMCEGKSTYFRIPQNTQRGMFFGHGRKTEVAAIQIEFWNTNPQSQEKFESFILTKRFPFKNNLKITPGEPYAYRFRTREDMHFWSPWSEEIFIVSEPAPFQISSVIPSREECQKEFEALRDGKIFRILMVGKPGAGKSDLVNSFTSAIEGKWVKVADTAPEGLTNTQCLTEYELVPGKVFLYDMPGFEDSFQIDLLKKILDGDLDDVTVGRLQLGSDGVRQTSGGHTMPKIDAVILVMSATSLDSNEKFHRKVTELLKVTRTPCLGVLTKLDEVDSKVNPISREHFLDDARTIALSRKIPLDAKFPLVNYLDDEITYPRVDGYLIHILKRAQGMSQLDSKKLSN